MTTSLPSIVTRTTPLRPWLLVLAGCLLLDGVSMLGWYSVWLGSIVTAVLVLAWLFSLRIDVGLAVVLLVTELILGSFGQLTSLSIGSTEISLRMALFLAAFAVMLVRIARNRQHIIFHHNWRWWFALAVAALLWAAGRGYYNWNSYAYMILDGNGYLYILLLPLFLEAYAETGRERLLYYAKIILAPALVWLGVRTIALLYLFTHFEASGLAWLYKWYRDSGLGEITSAGGGFFRIFSQSHLYASLGSLLGLAWLWHKLADVPKLPWREPMLYLTLICLITLLASLSRSLWLGAAVAWLLIPLTSGAGRKFTTWLKFAGLSFILLAAAAGAVMAISRLPWPVAPLGASSAQAFTERFGREPAAQTRLQLLGPLIKFIERAPVLGSGFGATLIYVSTDPRAINSTAGGSGLTLTYAFEWGYLDLWYKFGLVGLALLGGWLLYPWLRGLKLWRQNRFVGASAIVLTALYVTHLTTPYLNHPLGLGAVMALGAFVFSDE